MTESVDGARIWTFPDTPSLSTYVVVINAGPFHEIRREVDGYDLGLFSRQSTARFLEQAAEELFDLTGRGLRFFGERSDLPFPQRRYDQVFVPNMGGAMENWGRHGRTPCCSAAHRPTRCARCARRCCCTRWRTWLATW
ncbi:MAG: hypothetical protein R2734_01760 [Nocardioides sp.]